jgi:hypothetical protein
MDGLREKPCLGEVRNGVQMQHSVAADFVFGDSYPNAAILNPGTSGDSLCSEYPRRDAAEALARYPYSNAAVLDTDASVDSERSQASDHSRGDILDTDSKAGDTDSDAPILDTDASGIAERGDFAALSFGCGGLEVANLSSHVIG